MIFAWSIDEEPGSKPAVNAHHRFSGIFDQLVKDRLPGISFYGTQSVAAVTDAATLAAEHDMALADGIALPISALVLWYVVRSGRLLLIPLATLMTSAAVSFGLLYFLSLVVNVQVITPPLCMSLLIAMSVDYSLFLLTRFREELLKLGVGGEDAAISIESVQEAIKSTMTTSGATILLSGFTLLTAFAFLAVIPVDLSRLSWSGSVLDPRAYGCGELDFGACVACSRSSILRACSIPTKKWRAMGQIYSG